MSMDEMRDGVWDNLDTLAALVLIDLQVGNFGDEEPRIHRGGELLERAGRLLAWAREEELPVIFILNDGGEGSIDEAGSPGFEVHPALEPLSGEEMIIKTTPDSFLDTGLQRLLEESDITDLIITGLQTEICIDTTCRSAWQLAYDVTLVSDAHSTWDGDALNAEQIIAHHNSILGGWFVDLATTDEIVSGVQG